MNIFIALFILMAGFGGAYYHWIEVRKRGESENFLNYFFINHTPGSKATVVAFIASMETLYIAGTFDMVRMDALIEATSNGIVYSPFLGAIATAFATGYACDSKFNAPVPVVPYPTLYNEIPTSLKKD